MNRRTTVLAIAVLALGGFATAGYFYKKVPVDAPAAPMQESSTLVRPHSPVLGPANAPVTIVEFFDPSCEACRAFYPAVKQIMDQYPIDVRVVLRYTPFHEGSDEAVRILETARLQNVFVPVLEALLAKQPEWASDSGPQLDKAWEAAGAAGLDVAKAKETMLAPHIMATLNKDMEDGKTIGISGTPTFFVNGKPLPSFGVQELQELVRAEVAAVQ
ncbi:protein-disulfide isomerase [Aminobacter niigataensis]|uniref:Protein-disulfide isomerase n=1 Tax=Aminobacter niigataensis TaxID=83265 RepID=A0ABR6LBH0_9HYPH|nr:thioredoxin domain-containing protein [Aminobacter niigataensis]MBB4653355.1 protein-disulfide isomerase [Aminobacter niigataensis]